MIYCMADIHGEAERFRAMLKKINFGSEDTLFILGDVIDRYPGGIDILKVIMDAPNMKMILGNHEEMCLATLGPNSHIGAKQLWLQNGGSTTYNEMVSMMTKEDRRAILDYLQSLPDCLDLEVSGQKYHLVHAFPSENRDDRLWQRPEVDCPPPFSDRIAIIGHTPTCYLTGNFDEPYHIWHGDGIIDIDCGCGHDNANRRLACIRLDDREEFYI